MTHIYAVLSHGLFLQMIKPDGTAWILVSVEHPVCPM